MSSRVKIVPEANEGGSAPRLLIAKAREVIAGLDARAERDRVWFVIDTDRWREQLHEIRQECEQERNWRVAQSNPCFEVWLYFHERTVVPANMKTLPCAGWKPFLPTVIVGGFNAGIHPIAINQATINAKAAWEAEGYFPKSGCTAVWMLAEELLPLITKDLEERRELMWQRGLIS